MILAPKILNLNLPVQFLVIPANKVVHTKNDRVTLVRVPFRQDSSFGTFGAQWTTVLPNACSKQNDRRLAIWRYLSRDFDFGLVLALELHEQFFRKIPPVQRVINRLMMIIAKQNQVLDLVDQ
ncbi:MAG: hypothetical protein CVT82_15180 [Alphaproteobacteria bacterium HGW-Alphaproteobacteria-4]|nr:MAG: hypothetical protein CVT82_15180 [Alphaproteobacteria bacterium HGW-Alphaproteobacteria-4]